MQHLRAVVRDLGGFAMVQLRDEARVGHEPRIGGQDAGTSFHSTTRRAPSERAEQRRRQIACRRGRASSTLPSGARPMNPGTTAIVPAPSSGRSTLAAPGGPFPRGCGAAPPCWPSVDDDVARVDVRRPPARRRDERRGDRICADIRSPRETSRSLARGARCPSSRWRCTAPGTRAPRRRSSPSSAPPPGPAAAAPRATSRWRRRKAAATLRGVGAPPGRGGVGAFEQQVGDAGRARSDDDERAVVRGDEARRLADRRARRRATLRRTSRPRARAPLRLRGHCQPLDRAGRDAIDGAAHRVVVVRQLDRRIRVPRRHAASALV